VRQVLVSTTARFFLLPLPDEPTNEKRFIIAHFMLSSKKNLMISPTKNKCLLFDVYNLGALLWMKFVYCAQVS
jgi:protein-arginine kinase